MAEYIERDKVLAKAQWFEMYDGESEDSEFAMKYIDTDDVESIPSADVVEVVHGRWIGSYDFYCSVCGVYQNLYTGRTNYCPYCGARMDGERYAEIQSLGEA